MTDDATVKKVQIAGGRPNDLNIKRRRRTKRQEGGADETAVAAAPAITKMDAPPPQPVKTNIPPGPEITKATPTPAPATQTGGTTKVILKSKVKRTAKVLLKKKEAPGPAPVPTPTSKPLKVKTRKVILKSLNKRLKKTRHAVKQAQQLPIQQVRAVLVDKGLIKATSKAPESVLRQIYSDSLIVAKKTL